MASRTPKLQQRSEYNSHWGSYASTALLPNGSGAALSAADFSLEAGDVAFVTGSGLYVCTSPGTVGGADAVWAAAGGGAGIDLAFQGEVGDGATTGTVPEVIGAVYLPACTLAVASRVLLGLVAGGTTATCRIIRQSDSTVVATFAAAAPLGDVVLAAPVAVVAGWYVFDLAGDDVTSISRCYGAHLEWTV